MYLQEMRDQLSQGDIFKQVELVDSAAPTNPPISREVIVLSHNCEIIKPSNSIVLVCGIRSLSQVDTGLQGHIQRNRVYNAMHLESTPDMPESFVDFRYIYRVEKIFLEECMNQGLRIASINDEAQLALITFFYRFLIRKTP